MSAGGEDGWALLGKFYAPIEEEQVEEDDQDATG